MMRINVINKKTFDEIMISESITDDNVKDLKETFMISITDTDKFSKSREPHFKKNHDNVLNLAFDDCSVDGEASPTQPKGTKSMSQVQAMQLYHFIKRNLDKEQCIVHCMAGISRSGAVGTFINDLVKGDFEKFSMNNPQIVPNVHVMRLLNREMYNDLD